MKTCVFFGHRDFDYSPYKEKLYKICEKLIVEQKVTQFYTGGRGDFDRMAYETIIKLKKRYANVKLTLFLSYMPKENVKPMGYDDTEYVLDRRVYPKFAISETNKAVVDKSDFVVVGVHHTYGGAYAIYRYAKRKGKAIISIFK